MFCRYTIESEQVFLSGSPMAVDGLRTGRFLLDAIATEKIGLPLGQMVMVTSPRRDRYKVSRKKNGSFLMIDCHGLFCSLFSCV
jgi:hypothetical protein